MAWGKGPGEWACRMLRESSGSRAACAVRQLKKYSMQAQRTPLTQTLPSRHAWIARPCPHRPTPTGPVLNEILPSPTQSVGRLHHV
eukprot:scaffold277595_cov31-Tisochrysis_lutea.AAC.1